MPLPNHLRLNAFKYPLAFIRVIELVFVIIALSAVNGWSFSMEFTCPGAAKNVTLATTTFSLDAVDVETCETNKSSAKLWAQGEGYSGSGGFFYFVHSIALISLLAAAFFYVVLWEWYSSDGRVKLGDFALTALTFILFFFCTSIWWSACNGIGSSTDHDHIVQLLNEHPQYWNGTIPQGVLQTHTRNGLLTISVLCGWASVVLFAVNCWYVWKETAPTPLSNPTSIA